MIYMTGNNDGSERKIMKYKHIMALLIVVAFLGCGDKDKLAEVNGKKITKAEFESYLKFKRIKVNDEKRRAKILDQYVEREALASVVEMEKLLDNNLIQAELNEFKKEMLISRYFEKFLKDKVSPQAVQNYYNTHAGDYEQKRVRVAHILIRTNKKMSETERKAKLTTAQEAYSKIKKGTDFGEVAKEYSEDRISSKKGGELGWLKQGSIDPRFSKTIFELKAGEVSEPFGTAFGYHVVKILEEPKVVKKPFNAVAGNIRYQLRNQAKKAEMERLMKKVKIKKKN